MIVKVIKSSVIPGLLVMYASGRSRIVNMNKIPKSVKQFMDAKNKHVDKISGAEIWE